MSIISARGDRCRDIRKERVTTANLCVMTGIRARRVGLATVAGALVLLAGLPANASTRREVFSAQVAHHVQLDTASVTQVDPSHDSFAVVRRSNKTVFTVVYSATTEFFNSPLSDIKVGTVLTIAGVLRGRTLLAQDVSTKSVAGGSSGSGSGTVGVGGPFTGVKWVGNV
jgi:hypothetical protein